MKKDIVKKVQKDKVIKNELIRAHFMIGLLAVGIVLLTIINSAGSTAFSAVLNGILVVLTTAIALVSFAIVLRLSK